MYRACLCACVCVHIRAPRIITCKNVPRNRWRTCHNLHYFLMARRRNSSINLPFEEAISARWVLTGSLLRILRRSCSEKRMTDRRESAGRRERRPGFGTGNGEGNPSRARIPLSNPFNIKPPSPARPPYRSPCFFPSSSCAPGIRGQRVNSV